MRLRNTAAILVGVLSACAASGPKFSGLPPVTEGAALVVLYRPHTSINSGGYPHVYLNGEKKTALLDTGYVLYQVPPGEHKITLTNPAFWDGKQEWSFTIAAGQKQFFRLWSGDYKFQASGPTYYTSKTVTVAQVDEAAALVELTELHLSQ